MKNKIFVFLVPVILSILLSLYFTHSGASLIITILNPVNGCGLLLGLANLYFFTQPTLRYILINAILGILIFSFLYFWNKEFFLSFVLIGGVIGLTTGVIGSVTKKIFSPNTLKIN
jgi:hypothetical protein